MKIGVFSVLFQDKTFEEMLDYVVDAGVDMIEIGTGGNPDNQFCPLDDLLEDEKKRKAYIDAINKKEISISAFSSDNIHISLNNETTANSDESLIKTIKLASLLNVPVVNTFSGEDGSDETAKFPNWPVTPWPTVYSNI